MFKMSNKGITCFQNWFLFSGFLFAALTLGRWAYTWGYGMWLPDIWTVLSLLMTVLLLDIYTLKPAPSHSIFSLLAQYACQKIFYIIGKIGMMMFVKHCKSCKTTQEKLLMAILKQNKETMFFNDFALKEVNSVEEFRKRMPLTTYEDYSRYANMVTETGNENVLFPGKAAFVALTSGTSSGKSKAYPKSKQNQSRIMSSFMIVQDVSCKLGVDVLKKLVFLRVCPKLTKCKSGIVSGPVSALLSSSIPFLTVSIQSTYTEFEALYVQLIFALREDDVAYFSTQVATTTLTTFQILEKNWVSLCNDIEIGRIPDSLDISDDERKRLNALLKPCPARAEHLREEFSKGFTNVVARIWPSCRYIFVVKTGVFESAWRIVEEKYVGNLPGITLLHIGTETIYGVNINPLRENVSFAPLISLNFIEFIPEEEMENEHPHVLLPHQVEIGKTYELVITTYEGLYRYRTEDMVQISEFFHTTPMYTFVRRAGDILSVGIDKTPEFLLYDAVNEAAKQWTQKIVHFTSCEAIHIQKIIGSNDDFNHYFVLIETEKTIKLSEEDERTVDECLCRRHEVYAAMRMNKKLQQLRFIQLKPGTYEDLREMMLQMNPSAFCMQVKIPRILRRENLLQFVLDQKL